MNNYNVDLKTYLESITDHDEIVKLGHIVYMVHIRYLIDQYKNTRVKFHNDTPKTYIPSPLSKCTSAEDLDIENNIEYEYIYNYDENKNIDIIEYTINELEINELEINELEINELDITPDEIIEYELIE